jgi:hypothetical protein
MAKWFAIGFVVRVALGIIVLFLTLVNLESAMMHLLDPLTLFGVWVMDEVFPLAARNIDWGHPFYPLLNLMAGVLWGFLFMLGAWLFTAVAQSRRASVSHRP